VPAAALVALLGGLVLGGVTFGSLAWIFKHVQGSSHVSAADGRVRRDHPGRGSAMAETSVAAPTTEELTTAAPGPERQDLHDAVAELPRAFREVVVLHYLADLPVDDVAQLLGVPTGIVKSRLSRARAVLASRLPGYAQEVRHA